jgi:hypothetical protein
LPVTGIAGPDTERALIAAAASQSPQTKEFEAFDTELADEGLWELGGFKPTAVETPSGGRIKDKTPPNSADLVTSLESVGSAFNFID